MKEKKRIDSNASIRLSVFRIVFISSSAIGVLILAALILFPASFQRWTIQNLSPQQLQVQNGPKDNNLLIGQVAKVNSDSAPQNSSSLPAPRSPDSEEATSRSQFAVWLTAEAKNLNSTTVNAASKEVEMKNKAESLTDKDRSELVAMTLNTELAINERILATYLLSLNSNLSTVASLSQVAEAPLPDHGALVAHSAAELRRVQELSLRYTMVDELAQRARRDSQALATLKNLIEKAPSSEVRNYARRKAAEIRSI